MILSSATTTPPALRALVALAATYVLAPLIKPLLPRVLCTDDMPFDPTMLLLACLLYSAMGTTPDGLWNIDPSIGLFLRSGLPTISIAQMQQVSWIAKACHFVPRIRAAYGKANFWIPSESVSAFARAEALQKALTTLIPITYESPDITIDQALWQLNSAGLLVPAGSVNASRTITTSTPPPSARDFLLFAAIHYHAFWEWEVKVEWKGEIAFTTKGTHSRALFDVDSESMALPIVVAQLVRRPHAQSPLRAAAVHESDHIYGPYRISLDSLSRTSPACSIDFHSYATESSKVSASLNELAGAYYRVIQSLKRSAPPEANQAAHVQVGQTLWVAILGGAVLDQGRLTIQNLPGDWSMKKTSPDEAYLSRVEAILHLVEPCVAQKTFFNMVYSSGTSQRPALLFLFAGLLMQIAVCFLLSVYTSSGIWLSVAVANTIMSGKLTDWHSRFWGKTESTEQPGMKMYLPGTKDIMAIATFDRTGPRDGPLRPGMLLNLLGGAAAFLGAVFRVQARKVLGVVTVQPFPDKVAFIASLLCGGLSFVICITLLLQQARQRTWADGSELPTRWMTYATVSFSLLVSVVGFYSQTAQLVSPLWLLLDAFVWISGLPLGMLENGRIIPADEGTVQMILVNRWLMGVIVSAVASSQGIQ
ncbi:hypothetical protein B0H34DRAFT_745181 [Crassisporium funariophilum]|nr:hypothetical protein B0H34DRAFT_745181 [Crassisporium funariophilum]